MLLSFFYFCLLGCCYIWLLFSCDAVGFFNTLSFFLSEMNCWLLILSFSLPTPWVQARYDKDTQGPFWSVPPPEPVAFHPPKLPFSQEICHNQEHRWDIPVKWTEVSNQVDLTDILTTFYIKKEYDTFLSAPRGNLSTINHISEHKTNLNIYKKIKLILWILSNYHGLRLKFSNIQNNRKATYSLKLNYSLFSDHLVREGIKKKNQTL